ERTNFREIAKVLGAREGEEDQASAEAEPKPDASVDADAVSATEGQETPFAPKEPQQDAAPSAPPAAWRAHLDGAEDALRASEAEIRDLKSIIDTATDGVVVIAQDGRIAQLSRSAEALFGYEAEELRGRTFVELFAPESRSAAQAYLDGLTG